MVNQNSIEDISARIQEHITNDTFRGNIVISQTDETKKLQPYEEVGGYECPL